MKAVVMAGGEGKRLRPLTCDIPKPTVNICSKPVIEYIFDLLVRNGFDEAYITLGYLAEKIEDSYGDSYKNMKLHFIKEDKPLGTAGSVKNAAKDFDETFLVISGDAVCDFELDKMLLYHRSENADITVIGYMVDDPREYGLVNFDEKGRITSFCEKPSWSQAVGNVANTGIYIIEPKILKEIPDGEYDFAKQLFPKMLKKGKSLYCYNASGYWCDIGDIRAYLRCQKDMLGGKIKFPLKKTGEGIFSQGDLPKGDYTVIPPVYIGERVDIADSAVIGPNTVIESECVIGAGCKIRESVLLKGAFVHSGSVVNDALICSGATVRRGAGIYEQSVVGTKSNVGEFAVLNPKTLVWPNKNIESNMSVRGNVKYDRVKKEIFDDSGIGLSLELTPEMCTCIGSAIGSIGDCRKIGIGFDGSVAAKVLKYALVSGMMSSGAHVWSFGECFESQLSYCTAFCGLCIGIYVSGGSEPQIKVCGEAGLSVRRHLEREIESRLEKGEFNRSLTENMKDVADMGSIRLMYARELSKQAPYELKGMSAAVISDNENIELLMEDTFARLGCSKSGDLVFKISEDGMKAEAFINRNENIPHEKLLAICCLNELKNGRDLALPFDAPIALDYLATEFGKKAYRYLTTPSDDSDSEARRLSSRQFFVRDGLFMTVRVLSIMKEREASLKKLCSELPDFFVTRKTFDLSFPPSRLSDIFGRDGDSENKVKEGISIKRDKGRLLITPSRTGRKINVIAESDRMETSLEMCDGLEKLLKEIK